MVDHESRLQLDFTKNYFYKIVDVHQKIISSLGRIIKTMVAWLPSTLNILSLIVLFLHYRSHSLLLFYLFSPLPLKGSDINVEKNYLDHLA